MRVEESKVKIVFNEEERMTFEKAAFYLQEFMDFLDGRSELFVKIGDSNFHYSNFNNFVEALRKLGFNGILYIEK